MADLTVVIPGWLLWTVGIVLGVPLALFLLVALFYGVVLLLATEVDRG